MKKAREALTDAEYAATTKKKREDMKSGKQYSKQPKKIAKKTATHRMPDGTMMPGKRHGMNKGGKVTYNSVSDCDKKHS